MSTREIFNFRAVNERVLTGGQPTEEQLRAAAAEGVEVVINLATRDPRYSLPDEAGLVASLGMEFHDIPVAWEQPTPEDFAAFESAMASTGERTTLIHCAANFRVTAFYSLYAQKHLGWSEQQAADLRASVWSGDHPQWDAFIAEMQARLASG